MSFIFSQFLKLAIHTIDKEDITKDQIEYIYNKWGESVAEKVVQMLEDETKKSRAILTKLKGEKK